MSLAWTLKTKRVSGAQSREGGSVRWTPKRLPIHKTGERAYVGKTELLWQTNWERLWDYE